MKQFSKVINLKPLVPCVSFFHWVRIASKLEIRSFQWPSFLRIVVSLRKENKFSRIFHIKQFNSCEVRVFLETPEVGIIGIFILLK